MDFIHLLRDGRALSKILRSAIPIPVHGLMVKVIDFEFFVLNFYSVSFCKAFDWFESCLVWMDIRFLNVLERKSVISGELSCPATGLI